MSAPQTARERFEAWLRETFRSCRFLLVGQEIPSGWEYSDVWVQAKWQAWQAAERSALSVSQAQGEVMRAVLEAHHKWHQANKTSVAKPGEVILPLSPMARAPWNLLDDTGCRVAICGMKDGEIDEANGPMIAAWLASCANESLQSYDVDTPTEYADSQLCEKTIEALSSTPPTAVARVIEAARELEPHLDGLICYASTTSEHEPNRLVLNFRKALAGLDGGREG